MKQSIIKIIRICIALAITITFSFVECDLLISFSFCMIGYLIIGYDVLYKAVLNIFRGAFLDENFLMSLSTIGAFFVGDYPEALGVMIFYQIGEMFQDYAVNKSRRSIAELMDIKPDYANLLINDEIVKKNPEEIKIDDIILVKPGERIPLDGVIVQGSSSIDTKSLTGESKYYDAYNGDNVLSGCVNITGVIQVKVSKVYGESTVSKILDLVENASMKKAKTEKFITRFSLFYTPIVVLLAILLGVIPPLFDGMDFSKWVYRALLFLVVSCPCALVISVPMSFFAGIGLASREGILIKGSNYLEIFSHVENIVFDKTGTITKGNFKVMKVDGECLEYAAYAEYYSNHPIALSIKNEYHAKNGEIDINRLGESKDIPGFGVETIVDGKKVVIGNKKLMTQNGIDVKEFDGTVLYVLCDNKYIGHLEIGDEIKEGSKEAITYLNNRGIKTIMLTGDNTKVAQNVGNELGIKEIYGNLLPADKVSHFKEIKKTGLSCFIGDGINDAPVLALSNIGIAMGGVGSDAAIEASDIVIMNDDLSKIITTMDISKKTMRIVYENIIFALGVKALIMILGALGLVNMWIAVFGDVGVAFLAIINSMRMILRRVK